MSTPAIGYAAKEAKAPLGPFAFERRALKDDDVSIKIAYCGVCHSDLHTVDNDWTGTIYPVVPGHEIVGHVTAVGGAVTKFKVGDAVGVGCMVDSCLSCEECQRGLEQHCAEGNTGTYSSRYRDGSGVTYGGYSDHVVVREAFVLRVPDSLDLAGAAPLLCAGITTYSPLRQRNVTAGTRVGVVGLGGLGHMAVKLAKAMGAEVTVFTTSAGKAENATALGAQRVVISKDAGQMAAAARSLDVIIDTVGVSHDLVPYMSALAPGGHHVLVGAPEAPHPPVPPFVLILGRRSLAGSLIGGIAETQEMLDFCAKHNITSDIEIIPMDYINTAYKRMLASDVKYRFVIDMATLKKE